MRRLDIAEVILALAADRDRATAIAGDLAEESRGSALRFWWLVAQTSILQTSRQLSASPFGMFGAAFRTMVLQFFWYFLLFAVSFIGLLAAELISKFAFHHELISTLRQDRFFQVGAWIFRFLIPFMIGKRVARHYPGREGAVIATLEVLSITFMIVTSWLMWQFIHLGPDGHTVYGYQGLPIQWNLDLLIGLLAAIGGEVLDGALLAGGAAFGRYKSLRLN